VLDLATLKQRWRSLTAYERFEHLVTRFVMLLVLIVIVYSLILISVSMWGQLTLDTAFPDTTALKDVFGSILTVLILIEFNHSIALALTRRSNVLQARHIVLITILVIARKVILLDFSTASFQSFIGISAIALGFGLLYWLLGAPQHEAAVEPHSRGGDADP
jgi:uncharacterized membrane protein (DUF373 family)